jgi:hypothetical protein
MAKEAKKHTKAVQYIINSALKRRLYVLAAFAESFSQFVVSILAIVATINLPVTANPEILFWLRVAVSALAYSYWAISFHKAYSNKKPNKRL